MHNAHHLLNQCSLYDLARVAQEGAPMIKRIWLVQPLAFARVGSSKTPLQSFYWTANDLRPHGTGRTDIAADETLSIDEAGRVVATRSDTIVFKDDDTQIRPVCPFFELHGEWESEHGPITPQILKRFGHSPEDITWKVKHANLKAFHLTHSPGDRIEASLEIPLADKDFSIHQLNGTSPREGNPLIPEGCHIPMGAVQVTRPTADFPEFRLRFYAPPGKVYAPEDLRERVAQISQADASAVQQLGIPGLAEFFDNSRWKNFDPPFDLPPDQKILNPKAAWPRYLLLKHRELIDRLPQLITHLNQIAKMATGSSELSELLRFILGEGADVGNLPPGLFAYAATDAIPKLEEDRRAFVSSLGFVDDTGDGIISCELKGVGTTAEARIVVCPPAFSPDRRQPVSIADGLADRENRGDLDQEFIAAESTEEEVYDLLDRALETMGLSNLDVWNEFFQGENAIRASFPGSQVSEREAAAKLWTVDALPSVHDLPLTQIGRQQHRRNVVRWVLDRLVRDNPNMIERLVRPPGDLSRFYDQRMPALMRGGDRQALHLTKRQFDLLKGWAARLR